MPRNNATKATLKNKVRARYKPAGTPLFIKKLRKQVIERPKKPSSHRRPRAQKAPR